MPHWREPIEGRPWSRRDASACIAIGVFMVALYVLYIAAVAMNELYHECVASGYSSAECLGTHQ